jgi:hypothetical protein
MSSLKPSSSENASFGAFAKVDELVSKPVLGSDGAGSWQAFRKECTSSRPSAAPKAPLKRADKLGTGLATWEAERAHEAKVRREAGQAEVNSGYTTFRESSTTAEEAAHTKKLKLIESRIRPDDETYFIPAATFGGWKFDYVFTTRPDRGTGYFWDGMDSVKKLRGKLKHDNGEQPQQELKSNVNTGDTDDDATKPKRKKRKKSGPTIIEDPNNPLEQVAKILQKRSQALSGHPNSSLPAGWAAAIDPFSGKTYYFCSSTGERSWEKPTESQQLPDGWNLAEDASTGKTYYYHTNGETKWEKPQS